MVESQPSKLLVAGSSPVSRSKNYSCRLLAASYQRERWLKREGFEVGITEWKPGLEAEVLENV